MIGGSSLRQGLTLDLTPPASTYSQSVVTTTTGSGRGLMRSAVMKIERDLDDDSDMRYMC